VTGKGNLSGEPGYLQVLCQYGNYIRLGAWSINGGACKNGAATYGIL